MAVVYLSLGSNLRPEANLRLAIDELGKRFRLTAVSRVYRNEAVGFEAEEFLNAVACVETDMSPLQVCMELDAIHDKAGRERGGDMFVSRTLDIDLLLYDQEVIEKYPVRVPRADVLKYSFVLGPLAEIAPELIHPVSGQKIAEHWLAFDVDSHPLHREDFIL
jgi:2-amino-4-hydroxy-6-hydroxymethyldihydropteridine diphosphokinase